MFTWLTDPTLIITWTYIFHASQKFHIYQIYIYTHNNINIAQVWTVTSKSKHNQLLILLEYTTHYRCLCECQHMRIGIQIKATLKNITNMQFQTYPFKCLAVVNIHFQTLLLELRNGDEKWICSWCYSPILSLTLAHLLTFPTFSKEVSQSSWSGQVWLVPQMKGLGGGHEGHSSEIILQSSNKASHLPWNAHPLKHFFPIALLIALHPFSFHNCVHNNEYRCVVLRLTLSE